MDEKRFEHAISLIKEQTAQDSSPRNANVIVVAQSASEKIELPVVEGHETLSFLLDGIKGGAGTRLGTATSNGDILSLLVSRERFGQLALALSPTSLHLFSSLAHTPKEQRHLPDWTVGRLEDRERIWELLELVTITYAERPRDWETQVDALVLALLALWSADRQPEAKARSMNAEMALTVALQEIAAHPESVTLAGLARRLSYHANYLSGLLHKSCGKTFGELVVEQRMERAKLLLKTTGLPVSEVSRMTGYAGTSNFYRHFRNACGMSPSEYRARLRQSEA